MGCADVVADLRLCQLPSILLAATSLPCMCSMNCIASGLLRYRGVVSVALTILEAAGDCRCRHGEL